MSQSPDKGLPSNELRKRIDQIDVRIHEALMERASVESALTGPEAGLGGELSFHPERDADTIRQIVERHEGRLSLHAVENIWRNIICACTNLQSGTALHLDGSAELTEMLDLARFYFGFSIELVPGSDASDVVGAVGASSRDLGLVALTDRAELPWWRGLSEAGAMVCGRLPFVVLEDRPADLPALVLAKPGGFADKTDVAVYDARWSDLLPGKLMDQGMEVLSFFRSANGVDALLAVSGELQQDHIIAACAEAGAEPDVLRHVGGYAAPIDAEYGPEDDFSADDDEAGE